MPVTINFHWAAAAPTPADKQLVIQYAGNQWAAKLADNLTINVEVWSVYMALIGLMGYAFPEYTKRRTAL